MRRKLNKNQKLSILPQWSESVLFFKPKAISNSQSLARILYDSILFLEVYRDQLIRSGEKGKRLKSVLTSEYPKINI